MKPGSPLFQAEKDAPSYVFFDVAYADASDSIHLLLGVFHDFIMILYHVHDICRYVFVYLIVMQYHLIMTSLNIIYIMIDIHIHIHIHNIYIYIHTYLYT